MAASQRLVSPGLEISRAGTKKKNGNINFGHIIYVVLGSKFQTHTIIQMDTIIQMAIR